MLVFVYMCSLLVVFTATTITKTTKQEEEEEKIKFIVAGKAKKKEATPRVALVL